MRQENILLGFAEVMDLIDEQNRLDTIGFFPVIRSRKQGTQGGYIGQHTAGPLKPAPGNRGNGFGNRGFTATRWPIQDDAPQPVSFNGSAQELAFAQNMILSDNIIQRTRPHTSR
jgi:hypothetical protein